MAEQTEAQRLNAAKPLLTGQPASAFDPLVTPTVQRIIDEDPHGEDIYRRLARRQRIERQAFQIHHLENGSSLVVRSFDCGDYAVIMTEAESLNHYGTHRQIAQSEKHHHHNASTGWGIAQFGSSIGWSIFLAVLVIAITLHCHPEFLEVLK